MQPSKTPLAPRSNANSKKGLIWLITIVIILTVATLVTKFVFDSKYRALSLEVRQDCSANEISNIDCILKAKIITAKIDEKKKIDENIKNCIKDGVSPDICHQKYERRHQSHEQPIGRDDKPLIYIYPTKETAVSVKLSNPERLTTTYPKYQSGWKVIAQPNGNLKVIDGPKRTYYGLYWEGIATYKPEFNDGFVVAKSDLIPFLEDKLSILGLSEREANEFIMYWLPILERSDYQAIRFLTQAEINQNMKLSVSPEPDTMIRIRMQFKPVSKDYSLPEQQLAKVTRHGFTVIEWGGLSNNISR